MSKPFTAYWSLLGYLPDFVPPEFDTKDEALGYLADEIRLVLTNNPNTWQTTSSFRRLSNISTPTTGQHTTVFSSESAT